MLCSLMTPGTSLIFMDILSRDDGDVKAVTAVIETRRKSTRREGRTSVPQSHCDPRPHRWGSRPIEGFAGPSIKQASNRKRQIVRHSGIRAGRQVGRRTSRTGACLESGLGCVGQELLQQGTAEPSCSETHECSTHSGRTRHHVMCYGLGPARTHDTGNRLATYLDVGHLTTNTMSFDSHEVCAKGARKIDLYATHVHQPLLCPSST